MYVFITYEISICGFISVSVCGWVGRGFSLVGRWVYGNYSQGVGVEGGRAGIDLIGWTRLSPRL